MKKIIVILGIALIASCAISKKKEASSETQLQDIVVVETDESDEEAIYVVVETMPEFPGGIDSMMAYLGRTISYPEKARKKGIEGKVYVQFIVRKDGTLGDIKVIRGIGGGCDEESISAIKNMPNWTPGKQRGKPVPVRIVQPINFRLTETKKSNRN
jgi:protein TonB